MGFFSRSSDKDHQDQSDKRLSEENEYIIIVDQSIDPHLVMFHDPKSHLSEQYRHFRTNLMAMNKDGSSRSLVFTSTNQGEGKSITIANVALSLVESTNTRVCLIDSDFRAPAMGKMFGLDEGLGLSELLSDRLSLDKVLQPTKMENLSIIQAGREPNNSTELLGSERLGNLVNALKQDFNYILFDTPPVFPYTDACILGARCNGIIMVIKMERTNRMTVEKAVDSLETAGGQVLGTFLTAIRPTTKEESKEYYYQYREEQDLDF